MSVLLSQAEENLLESHPWKLPLHILWREPPSQADYPPGTSYKTRPHELSTLSRPERSPCPLSVDGDSLCLAPNLLPLDQPETPTHRSPAYTGWGLAGTWPHVRVWVSAANGLGEEGTLPLWILGFCSLMEQHLQKDWTGGRSTSKRIKQDWNRSRGVGREAGR